MTQGAPYETLPVCRNEPEAVRLTVPPYHQLGCHWPKKDTQSEKKLRKNSFLGDYNFSLLFKVTAFCNVLAGQISVRKAKVGYYTVCGLTNTK